MARSDTLKQIDELLQGIDLVTIASIEEMVGACEEEIEATMDRQDALLRVSSVMRRVLNKNHPHFSQKAVDRFIDEHAKEITSTILEKKSNTSIGGSKTKGNI